MGHKGPRAAMLVILFVLPMRSPHLSILVCTLEATLHGCSSLGLSWSSGFGLGSADGRLGGETSQGGVPVAPASSLFHCGAGSDRDRL